MRFSILIPVFNFDVSHLLKELYKQSKGIGSDFEILIFDDCSSSEYHLSDVDLEAFPEANYRLLKTNLGRSRIRNLLISEAKFENCLIMDCDMMPNKSDDVKTYFEALQEADVVVGGHVYQPNSPKDNDFYLHWLYGSKKEVQSLKQRQKHPFEAFKTSVFAFKKSKIKPIVFDESISTYGHEDTCFGWEMEAQGLNLKHIERPFVHLGLESKANFLEKQKLAVENLYKLYQNPKYKAKLDEFSSLIKIAKNPLIRFVSSFLNTWSAKVLEAERPSLLALYIFKLNLWMNIKKM